ncbi:hypothetical protein [Nesterenkonia sp. PF2B19]|uniref:hypothetical protein n=1 Tax=Nesterenkonia sp. PF2B19 TaxID=1881858 RepID=UPI0008733E72|nr:hypothetical protein [Nesterenkonia sp. PF2B19]OSM42505.1 hypothetical protein BCY76_014030 [Nesterenkonia sp. PF2B19]
MSAGAAASEREDVSAEVDGVLAEDGVQGDAGTEHLPEVVEALLDQQRALLRELQWSYQQLDTFNRNETQRVLKNLASTIASSPAVSTEVLQGAEDTLRKEIRRGANYAQRVPPGFPRRFEDLEHRLGTMERRLEAVEKRLKGLEAPVSKVAKTLSKVDRSVERLAQAENRRSAAPRQVKRAVKTLVPAPVVHRVRRVISRTGAGR